MDRLSIEQLEKWLKGDQYGPDLPSDPRTYEAIAQQLLDTMRENEWFREGLQIIAGSKIGSSAVIAEQFLNPNKDSDHVGDVNDMISTQNPELYVHGPISTTVGDVRDPSTWETTEKYPTRREQQEIEDRVFKEMEAKYPSKTTGDSK